jgi:hypothetical protein
VSVHGQESAARAPEQAEPDAVQPLQRLRAVWRRACPKTLTSASTVLVILILLFAIAEPVPAVSDLLALFALVLVCRVVILARRSRHRGKRSLRRTLAVTAVVVAVVYASSFAILLATESLAFLAASGSGSSPTSSTWSSVYSENGAVSTDELAITVAVLGLLLWIPHLLFRIKLDIDGKDGVQGTLLAVITAGACALTGTYIILLHFADGPLRSVHVGTLVAGTLFTLVLVAPYYRALARTCWRRGMPLALNPKAIARRMRDTVRELGKAVFQATEPAKAPVDAHGQMPDTAD